MPYNVSTSTDYQTELKTGLIFVNKASSDNVHELFLFQNTTITKLTSNGGSISTSDFSFVDGKLRIKKGAFADGMIIGIKE